MMMALTNKQELFCQKYIELDNASDAYRAVYDVSNSKPATINRKAKELMDNGKIAARIAELQAEAKERFEITVDKKKAWLVEIVERSLQHVPVLDYDGEESGEFKFDANAAVRAINELNRMDGDHAPQRKEHTGKDGKPIQTESTTVNRLNFIPVGNIPE